MNDLLICDSGVVGCVESEEEKKVVQSDSVDEANQGLVSAKWGSSAG